MKYFAFIAGTCIAVYIAYRTYRIWHLDKGLDKLAAQGAVILDVRTEPEFRRGHIPGAVNIPLSRLRSPELMLDSSKVFITYCSHGLRSVKAVDVLKARGFRKVYNGGAMEDLQKSIGRK